VQTLLLRCELRKAICDQSYDNSLHDAWHTTVVSRVRNASLVSRIRPGGASRARTHVAAASSFLDR
jgi:hypothetical protein